MSYRIISADCHIDMTWMPGDLWVKNAPARMRDQVPQVRQTPDGPRWFAEEKELGVFGGLGFGFDKVQRNFSKHVERMFQAGFYEGGPHPTTPASPSTNLNCGKRSRAPEKTMLARNSAATIWNMVVRVARYLRS